MSITNPVTAQFWETHHAVHVSFARPVSFGHLPEAPSIMNGMILTKTEPLPNPVTVRLTDTDQSGLTKNSTQ
jgi:hypothetical protein